MGGALIGLGVLCLIWLVVALAASNERIKHIIMWNAYDPYAVDEDDDL